MNEQTTGNPISDILSVAGGNREFKVGFYQSEIYLLGATILMAVFIGVTLANIVSKKLV